MAKSKLLRSFIQGKKCHHLSSTSSAPTCPIVLLNPANATPHAHYHPTQSAELTHALTFSQTAQKEWACTSPSHRSSVLRRAVDIVSHNIEALSKMETMDTGRPVRETECDVHEGIDCLNYYAGLIAATPHGEMHQFHRGNRGYTTRQPLGVCLGIGAWNYPLQGVLWKSVPALAFGNSMIFKPSEFTPSTALWLEECFVEAGVPEAVFQVSLVDGGLAPSRHSSCGEMRLENSSLGYCSPTTYSGSARCQRSSRTSHSVPTNIQSFLYRIHRHWSKSVSNGISRYEKSNYGIRWKISHDYF